MQRPTKARAFNAGETLLLDAFLGCCSLLPIHLTAAAALGISSSAHQQVSSGQGKEQQAHHWGIDQGHTSTLRTLSAVGACLSDKGLNRLLDPTTPHHRITDANKFSFSNHNLFQGLDCYLSIQILFST